MLFIKTAPAGIDIRIQSMQQGLYNALVSKWGIDQSLYNCYGRCYRNQRDDDWIPEVYNGAGEYQELFVDDRMAAISFFGIGETMSYDKSANTADVHLIFLVNCTVLKGGITWRADEEVRNDVQNYCANGRFGFMLTGIDLWLDKVFREYRSWMLRKGSYYDAGQIKYRDMQPFHFFRLNFKVAYSIYDCN